MTATPRIYNPDIKEKAERAEAVLCSMDDEAIYGQEIHRIGFGEAVERGLLSDYKVLIFTVDEKAVPVAIQESFSRNNELPADAPAQLIGCINALSKQIFGDSTLIEADPHPMMRAVAFCQNIAQSKAISKAFNDISAKYLATLSPERREKIIGVRCRHVDG